MRIMEKKMETTVTGFRTWGFGGSKIWPFV